MSKYSGPFEARVILCVGTLSFEMMPSRSEISRRNGYSQTVVCIKGKQVFLVLRNANHPLRPLGYVEISITGSAVLLLSNSCFSLSFKSYCEGDGDSLASIGDNPSVSSRGDAPSSLSSSSSYSTILLSFISRNRLGM